MNISPIWAFLTVFALPLTYGAETQDEKYYTQWKEIDPYSQHLPSKEQLKGNLITEFDKITECLKNRTGECEKGYIFEGPPGNGKSTLIEALIKESHATGLKTTGGSFEGKFNGTGPERVKKLFNRAKELSKNGPVIIFVEEMDGLGARGEQGTPISQYWAQTLGNFIDEINSLPKDNSIMLLGTTNHIRALDEAFTREERCLIIHVAFPDLKSRKEILEYYLSQHRHSLSPDEIATFAKLSDGFRISALKRFVKNAANLATGNIITKELSNEAFKEALQTHKTNKAITDQQRKKDKNQDDLIAAQLSSLKQQERKLPSWIPEGRTIVSTLIQLVSLYITATRTIPQTTSTSKTTSSTGTSTSS